MSRLFGPIAQNGYIVDDVEKAMDHWATKLGVGPFFYMRGMTFQSYAYKGRKSAPVISVAMANSGDLQIELIQQLNDAPSSYKEFLKESGPGLQHVAVWRPDYDAAAKQFQATGLEVLQEGSAGEGRRFAYYDTRLHSGCIMEVFELAPATKEFFDVIRDAAKTWDGIDPIREINPNALPS
jgi:4-hydroxyphenylpyruvate dioxygenase-like putative hemolysin